MKPTLTKKIGLLLLLPFIGSLGGMLVFSLYLERTRTGEHVVNVAGRQRLLTMELRDWTRMVALGQDDDRPGLESRIAVFDDVVARLQRGGPLLGVDVEAVLPELRPNLTAIAALWAELRPELRIVAAERRGEARFATAVERVERGLPRLLDASDRFVVFLVAWHERERKKMQWTLGLIAAMSFAVLAIGVLLTRLFIVRPLVGLESAAERIRAGNFSVRLDASSRDEIGSLARAFNEMVAQAEQHVMEGGKVIGVLGARADVNTFTAAAAAASYQAALLKLSSNAIIECSLDRRITFWNDAAARLYGWGSDEVLGKLACTSFSIPSERAHLDEAWEQLLAQGEWHGEVQQSTRDGRKLVMQSSWTLVRDPAGEPRSMLSINTDLTERRALESQMFRAQRMDSLGTMAGGIAHDLNNVFQPILFSVDGLRSELSDAEQLETLDLIHASVQRGAALVRQVLDFARGADGQRAPVHLESIVENAVRIVQTTVSKDIDFTTAFADCTCKVSGDATQLHQVVMNLCLNATDAMPHGGTITVSVLNAEVDEQFARMHLGATVGPYVTVHVTDTGAGMPADVLDRIFEPFFTTKGPEKGTGLGLATVHAIVRGHDGFILVQSAQGMGTTFSVYLPATCEDAAFAEATAKHRAHLADLAGHGDLILVVDDEEATREIMRTTLEESGYRVVTAADGVEALVAYSGGHGEIAVVLTDMMMPVLGGVALIEALRRIDPGVRLVAVSGLTSDEQARRQLGTTQVPFLHKPFTAEQLLEALATLLHS